MFENRLPASGFRLPEQQRGFTLLEVMVSLAILAISLVAILNMHSGSVAMHNHAKHMTVATLLARSQMVEVEEKLYEEDKMPEFNEVMDGDFEDAGFPKYKWRAEILKPDIELDATAVQGFIAQAMGIDPEADSGGGAAGGGGMMGMLGGSMQGMVTSQLSTLTETIEQSVREVRLTITWSDITGPSELEVVTHMVRLPGQPAPGSNAAEAASLTNQAIEARQSAAAAAERLQNLPQIPNLPGVSGGIRQAGRPPVVPNLGGGQ